MAKALTLRLDDEQARDLETVARVDRIPVSEAIRQAIDEHIDVRRKDVAFQERRRRLLEENREILERLA